MWCAKGFVNILCWWCILQWVVECVPMCIRNPPKKKKKTPPIGFWYKKNQTIIGYEISIVSAFFVQRGETKMCKYEECLFWAESAITDTLTCHHASVSAGLQKDACILYGSQLLSLGSSPNNFIDVYLLRVQNGCWNYCAHMHKRELSSVFSFSNKKPWKDEHEDQKSSTCVLHLVWNKH